LTSSTILDLATTAVSIYTHSTELDSYSIIAALCMELIPVSWQSARR